MKILITVMAFTLFSFAACSKEEATKNAILKAATTPKQVEATKTAPCDSKEDLLKKLEENKKMEEEKAKGFSLQGGDTGCSVK